MITDILKKEDKLTDTQMDTQIDRQTDIQTNGKTEGTTHRRTNWKDELKDRHKTDMIADIWKQEDKLTDIQLERQLTERQTDIHDGQNGQRLIFSSFSFPFSDYLNMLYFYCFLI